MFQSQILELGSLNNLAQLDECPIFIFNNYFTLLCRFYLVDGEVKGRGKGEVESGVIGGVDGRVEVGGEVGGVGGVEGGGKCGEEGGVDGGGKGGAEVGDAACRRC